MTLIYWFFLILRRWPVRYLRNLILKSILLGILIRIEIAVTQWVRVAAEVHKRWTLFASCRISPATIIFLSLLCCSLVRKYFLMEVCRHQRLLLLLSDHCASINLSIVGTHYHLSFDGISSLFASIMTIGSWTPWGSRNNTVLFEVLDRLLFSASFSSDTSFTWVTLILRWKALLITEFIDISHLKLLWWNVSVLDWDLCLNISLMQILNLLRLRLVLFELLLLVH